MKKLLKLEAEDAENIAKWLTYARGMVRNEKLMCESQGLMDLAGTYSADMEQIRQLMLLLTTQKSNNA